MDERGLYGNAIEQENLRQAGHDRLVKAATQGQASQLRGVAARVARALWRPVPEAPRRPVRAG